MPKLKGPAPGKKTPQQIRQESGVQLFTVEELGTLGAELEAIYNKLDAGGAAPSNLYEKLLLVIKQEHDLFNHPEVDPDFKCPRCKRR